MASGKIKYFLTAAHLKNNGTTTATGYALDARYGKTLYDRITTVNNTATAKTLHTITYFEPARSTSIGAGSRYDKEFSDSTTGITGVLAGFTVLTDKNGVIIVNCVSAGSGKHTFRFFNPTSSTQTSQGLVFAAVCQY